MEIVTTKKRMVPYSFALLVYKFLINFNTGGFKERMGNLNSAFGQADSQWEQIFKCRLDSYIYKIIHFVFISRIFWGVGEGPDSPENPGKVSVSAPNPPKLWLWIWLKRSNSLIRLFSTFLCFEYRLWTLKWDSQNSIIRHMALNYIFLCGPCMPYPSIILWCALKHPPNLTPEYIL